jgi:hypothetical protein
MDTLLRHFMQHLRNDPALAAPLTGPAGPPGPPGPSAALVDRNMQIDTRWNIGEFSLFHPDLPVDTQNPNGDIIKVGRDTIYRNIDAFCEHVQDAIARQGAVTIRQNLHLRLRGMANYWWTSQVSDLNKSAMLYDSSPNLIQCTIWLRSRFRCLALGQSNPLGYYYGQPSPLGTSQPSTQNTPLTSINSQHVTGKEASTPIQEPSPLYKIQSLPFPWENPPPAMEQPTFNRKNVYTQLQPTAFYFEDLPIVDYNTFGTNNFHQEVKVTEFNYRDQPVTATAHCNNFASKDSHQESRHSMQTPISPPGSTLSCDVCQANYSSRNKLFRHIREAKHHRKRIVQSPTSDLYTTTTPTITPETTPETTPEATPEATPEVIKSNAPPATGSGMAFQNFNYVEITARSTPDGKDTSFCADTGCGMSSMDKSFFKSQFPNAIVRQSPVPVEIRGIGNQIHFSRDYSLITFFLPGHKVGKVNPSLAAITREFHLVNNLACNALIGNDIIDTEGIKLNVQGRQATVGSC